ncbi:hypothetical protein SAY87_030581 [Trapa incisa]|uniref:VAN3-binding protein n=1 Tax=Trapa incisa TaxID=236973 RepID=A0AAN7KPQ5_9MYRT|nr:hypothetical protein SAY87_030581 [Trapa incisa]
MHVFFAAEETVSPCMVNNSPCRLENIDENSPAGGWVPAICPAPETPTESMEFLARSWSLSAMELSKALTGGTHITSADAAPERPSFSSLNSVESAESVLQTLQSGGTTDNVSPRDSGEVRELYLLHQSLNPEFFSNQQLLRNGLYKSITRGKTMGRWLKDQKEKKKQETRAHNAQLHAAVSVAGVAAAVASIAASSTTFPEKSSASSKNMANFKTSTAIASAAALVASHCIDLAEEMGADHGQVSTVVSSAVNARTNGDIMALTAGAATALRAAATLKARLQKGYGGPAIGLGEDRAEANKENIASVALDYVSRGGELLKRTRKGALHWKLVSFNIDSNFQVVVKLKSKHMAGAFTKKKKLIVLGVYCEVPAWPGREEKEDERGDRKAYFGIKTEDRIVEFECRNTCQKQLWAEGIQHMLNYSSNMT